MQTVLSHTNPSYTGELTPDCSVKNACSTYLFGFQGQEKDVEITGQQGSHLAFKYRIHDARIGRFLSIDPLTKDYPWNSPYAFSENKVISHVELEGLEGVSYYETMNVMGTEMPIKKVYEMDVYVAVGEGQYNQKDIKRIQTDLDKEYNQNGNFTDASGVEVEFKFNVEAFNSNKTSPEKFAKNLKKNPDNFEDGANGYSKYPRGMVLNKGNLPEEHEGETLGNLVTIGDNANDESHTIAHEMGHGFLNYNPSINPSNKQEHQAAGGIFRYRVVDPVSGNVIEPTRNLNQDNVDRFDNSVPNTKNKSSGIEIKTVSQEKGL